MSNIDRNKATKAGGEAAKPTRKKVDPERVQVFVEEIFGPTQHARRVESLANAVVGITEVAVLSIHAIGQAYAQVADRTGKSGVKQIDRLLSNDNVVLSAVLKTWVGFVIGARRELVMAMDWTDFDADRQTTLAVYLITDHGRATPLCWKTYLKAAIKNNQKRFEREMVEQLHEWIDPQVRITLLADRGFGDQNLYDYLLFLGWDFVIRFRGNIMVTAADGERRTARQWVSANGRSVLLRKAKVTADEYEIPAVVVTWDKRMKEPWCLATTLKELGASKIVKRYGRRFTIEETFRDQKDGHFGMGLKATHIGKPERRDRLLLLAAMTQALLTMLGAAAERAGLDKYQKSNTVKRRQYSLFRQGLYWYGAIPAMREEWLVPLMTAFDAIVREHTFFRDVYGVI